MTGSQAGKTAHVDQSGWLTRGRCAGLLAAICLLCILLDIFFFTGYYASDDRAYFAGAARVAETGHLGEPLLAHTRLTVMGWNLLVGSLCRFNVQAIAGSYIFFHVWLILLTFKLAEKLGDRRAGLIAAYASATFPLYIIFASSIYPDLPLTCFLVLSLLAYLNVHPARRDGRLFVAAGWMLLSGVCVGIAYMAKESALPALPFYFFAWLLTEIHSRPKRAAKTRSSENTAPARDSAVATGGARPPRWIGRAIFTGAGFAIGFFLVFGAEYKLLSHWVGRPFLRLAWTEKEDDMQSIANFHIDGGYNPLARLRAARDRLAGAYYPYDSTAELALLGLVLIAYALSKGRSWPLLLLGLWMFAYLTWGSYSLKHYYPPRIQARYFIPVFPFLIAVFGITASRAVCFLRVRLRTDRARRAVTCCAAAVILLVPWFRLQGADRLAGSRIYRVEVVQLVADALLDANRQQADRVVVSRDISARIGEMWYRGLPAEPDARRPENVMTSAEMQDIDTEQLFASGRFHYIELLKEVVYSESAGPVREFDQLLHPALANRMALRAPPPEPGRSSVKYLDAMTFACTESDSLGVVQVGRYELAPALASRHEYLYKSRTKELHHRFTNTQLAGRRYFGKAFQIVDVYRVETRPVRVESDPPRDLLAAATNWRVSGAAVDLSRDDRGQVNIALGEKDKTALITPAYDQAGPEGIELPPWQRCRLKIDVERTDDLAVDCLLVIPVGDDADQVSPPLRARLQSGINEVGFYTKRLSRRVTPTFELAGPGTLKIKSIQYEIQRARPD